MTYCSAGPIEFLLGCLWVKRQLHFYAMQILPCEFAVQTTELLNHVRHLALYILEQEQPALKTRQYGRETYSLNEVKCRFLSASKSHQMK